MLIVLLIVSVLVSAILERVIPRVSLPLIQIALGVLIGIIATQPIEIDFDPEFFLIVFIAPLLFKDAKESDKLGLVRNRQAIFSLGIALVIVIMLVVGFIAHLIEPSISLAAAFALGAALGPTDAVAVSSLSEEADPSRKENALLSGEALINDASGVVAFQFAISAAVTGTFAVATAAWNFAIAFVGGILLGLLLGWLANKISELLIRFGLDSPTFHVLFDVAMPFIFYLVAELLSVSGILAVVAAGIVISVSQNRRIGPTAAELSIVSSSVWSVLAFALNGVVFTILGIELPMAMDDSWYSTQVSNANLLLLVGTITAVVVLTRFIWVLAMEAFGKDRETKERRGWYPGIVRSALVTTMGGPKGAVTLSVVLTIPHLLNSGEAFPQRDLIIFVASGVILCTLLLANFLLPVLAPKKDEEEENEETKAARKIEIFRRVVERLTAVRTRETAASTSLVVASYNDRITRLQTAHDLETFSENDLRVEIVTHQINYLDERLEANDIDSYEGYRYIRRLMGLRNRLIKDRSPWNPKEIAHRLRQVSRSLKARKASSVPQQTASIRANEIHILSLQEAVRYLDWLLQNDSPYPAETISHVMLSYQRSLRNAQQNSPSITSFARTADKVGQIQRLAYNMELDEVQKALDEKRISRATAKEMRENVYLMLVDLEVLGE